MKARTLESKGFCDNCKQEYLAFFCKAGFLHESSCIKCHKLLFPNHEPKKK